ncbi:peptide-N4-asparagine amidase [Metallosphaera hakonensis]|nr:peptide-N4-asparagine amidase [Metallosphaera hakonensis]
MYENLLRGNVTFEPVLVNFYDAKVNITGVYLVNITLLLYPGREPQGLPNRFIPLFVNGTFHYNYSYVILSPTLDSFTSQVSIPNGTYRMTALLYEEGGGLDEFWYSNEPATREITLHYNGLLASIIPPYETIYTGGLDLFWWKPMPSINTLAFHTPYQADLTPFLAMGGKVNLTISVTNLVTAEQINHRPSFDWDLSGVLMLWVNQSNPMIGGKMIMAYSKFLDSSPIFQGGYSGIHYQEGGSYLLKYSSILNFLHGQEIATMTQSGSFSALQTFNNIYELAYLDESFNEISQETGIYSSSMTISGNYPVYLQISAFATPITPTNAIPYNLSYAQNGSISLGANYQYNYTFNGFTSSQSLKENLTAQGGFSGILEVINSYGGAVLVKLTSNNALTEKQLSFIYETSSGVPSFKEGFSAVAGQNSSVNSTGYYLKVQKTFNQLPDPGTTTPEPTVAPQEGYHQNTLAVSPLFDRPFRNRWSLFPFL